MDQNNSEHYEFCNSNLVIEEIPEDIENYKIVNQEAADENKIKVTLVMQTTRNSNKNSQTQITSQLLLKFSQFPLSAIIHNTMILSSTIYL